ncbi:MAG TPA: LysR family transcriptional regulator [Verrucomicrobiae bacterium]|nr:LysR family transcriptional regulator [Verrucomicrobiae bacterium]
MPSIRILPRLRVVFGRNVALGPGKVELLEHIVRTGCLRKAAAAMEMSYMRAWMLVQTMNRCFKKPLVVTKRGGAKGGTAVVTDEGRAVLALYRRMEAESLRAVRSARKELSNYLR